MTTPSRRAAGVAVVMTVLAACGSARPSATSSPRPQDSVVTTRPSASPASAAAPWTADGASFGVDSTSWPTSLTGAVTLLAAMPAELRGEERELVPGPSDGDDGHADEFAMVFYGEDLSVLVSDDTLQDGEEGEPQEVGAQSTLAAMFGLGYSCAADTYEGTIASAPGYPMPGTDEVAAGTPAWFSCRIDGAEGAENFSAHAVGWTSDATAWLTVGPDEAAVRELVTALHSAAG